MSTSISSAFQARKGIDLAAPGGVAALLEFHRGFFGDATMQEESPGEPAGQQSEPAGGAQERAGQDGDSALGEAGKKDLNAEREANQQLRSDLTALQQQLKEYQDREKTDEQKQSERLTELEQKAEKAERSVAEKDALILKYQVAADKGLDLAAAERLRGTTKDEIAQDADEWITRWGNPRTPGRDLPDRGQGHREKPAEDDYAAGLERATKRFGTPNT